MTATVTLSNGNLTACFDRRTGALLDLTSRKTGWKLLNRPELGLSFRMLVPLPDRHTNLIRGEQQQGAACRPSPDGHSVTFTWERLVSEQGGEHPIGFTGTATLTDQGLTFTGRVENRSDLTVEVVAYPCLGDLSPSRRDAKLEHFSMAGNTNGWRSALYPDMGQGAGYWGVEHLVVTSQTSHHAPFLLLAEEDQGLYVGFHQVAPDRLMKCHFEQRPGHLDSYTSLLPEGGTIGRHTVALEALCQQFLFAGPGTTTELAPVVLQPYQGTWHAGVDLYRAWRKTWFVEPAMPEWVKDIHAWLQIQIHCAEDSRHFRYTDLPAIAQDCKAHGITAIQLTGWAWGGQDRGNPRHDTDPDLGTREELAEAIRVCQDELGVKIILFTKWTWYDESQPFYKTEGLLHVARDPYGNPYPGSGYQYHTWTQLANLNTRRLIPTCTASPEWREVAREEFKKVVDLGAAGMLFDECQHHGNATYCFSREHRHPNPAFLHGSDNVLIHEFKTYSDRTQPQFLFCGEDCTDFEMLEYHLAYTRFGKGSLPVRRYITTTQPLLVAVTGFDDRNPLNKCLQYRYLISYEPFNFKGRPSDAPLTVQYGNRIDALRRRYRDYLWEATFRHVCGAGVTVDGKPYDDFTVFERPDGKRALVIANIERDRTLSAAFAFEGGPRGTCVQVDPEHPEPRPANGTVTLAPRSVIVVIER